MINAPVLDSLTIGSPTTNEGGLNLFGDGTVSHNLIVGNELVMDHSFSISSSAKVSESANTISIDLFATTQYRSAQYNVQVTGEGRYHATTVYVLQDENDVYVTEQGTLYNRNLGSFSANLDTSKMYAETNVVNLLFTPNTSEKLNIRVSRTAFFK
jgi:hypothetical protein